MNDYEDCNYLQAKINDIPWMPLPRELIPLRKILEQQITKWAQEQCRLLKQGKITYLGKSIYWD